MNLHLGAALAPVAAEHEAFVCKSLRESLIDFAAMSPLLARAHRDHLWSEIRGGTARAVVASPLRHPETFVGWAAESCGSLLFCYVPADFRGEGIARKLVAGLFSAGPIRLVYWTDMAESVREHGFPLIHDWREFTRRERLVDRAMRWRQRHSTERAA